MRFQASIPWLIVLLFLATLQSFGQDTISHIAGEGRYIIRYRKNPALHEKVNSEVTREIAKVTLCGLKNATIDVQYRYHGTVTRVDERCQLTMDIRIEQLTHPFHYRGFEMTPALRPSGIGIFATITDQTGESWSVHEWTGIAEADTITLVNYLNEECREQVQLRLDSLTLYYLPADLDRLFRQERYIDDYHALPGLAEQMEKTWKDFTSDDYCSYLNQGITLFETRFIINHYEQQDLQSHLPLGHHDPVNFAEKFLEIKRLYYSLFFNLKEKLHQQERLACYQKGDEWIPYLVDLIAAYYNKSFQAGDAFAPVYATVPDGFFTRETYQDLDTLLADWFRATGNDYHPGVKDYLFAKVEERMRKKISQSVQEEHYALAMELLNDLSAFCQSNPFTTCGNHEEVADGTVEGVFMAYLGIASSALDMGKSRFAMEYMEKARRFLEKNKHPRRLEEMLEKAFQRLVDRQSVACQALSDRHQVEASIKCYKELVYWCENSGIPGCQDMVLQRIRSIHQMAVSLCYDSLKESLSRLDTLAILRAFQKLNEKIIEYELNPDSLIDKNDVVAVNRLIAFRSLQDGIGFLEAGHAYHAYDCFSEARSILVLLPGSYDSARMDSLIRLSEKKILLSDMLTSKRNMEWDLEHTWNDYVAFRKRQDDLHLKEDGDVNKSLFEYLQKYDREKCLMVRKITEVDRVNLGKWRLAKRYEKIDSTYRRIRDVVGLFPECQATLVGLDDSISKYNDPAAYQRMIRNLEQMICAGEYPSVFSILPAVQAFYQDHHIELFQVGSVKIDDFLFISEYHSFRQFYLAWLLEEGKPVESLAAIFSFRESFPGEDIDPVFLKKLGKAFGNRDFLDDPASDPVVRSSQLSRDATWMEPFRSGYLIIRKPPRKLNLFGN